MLFLALFYLFFRKRALSSFRIVYEASLRLNLGLGSYSSFIFIPSDLYSHRGILMNIIETLRRHEKEIKKRYGVKRIGVFGSYVRGEEREKSDIDILVEFDEPTFDNFINLFLYLEKLFGRKVDLVTTKALSPYISPIVEKEVVWCE